MWANLVSKNFFKFPVILTAGAAMVGVSYPVIMNTIPNFDRYDINRATDKRTAYVRELTRELSRINSIADADLTGAERKVKERYAFAIGLQNKMNAMYAANPEDPNIKPMKMLHDNLILSVTLLPVVMARQVKETRGLDVPVEEMREFLWDLRERTKNSPLPSSTEDFKKMSQKLSKEEFKKMFFSPQSPFLDLQISAEMEEFLKKPSYQPAFAPGAEFKRPL